MELRSRVGGCVNLKSRDGIWWCGWAGWASVLQLSRGATLLVTQFWHHKQPCRPFPASALELTTTACRACCLAPFVANVMHGV